MKVKDSPNCIFFKENDDIIHFFGTCKRATEFWKSFKKYWIKTTSDARQPDIKALVFGEVSNETNLNMFMFNSSTNVSLLKKSKFENNIIEWSYYLLYCVNEVKDTYML